MRPNVLFIALLTLGLAACSSGTTSSPDDAQLPNPNGQIAAGVVQITVAKTSYSRADVLSTGSGVRATIANPSDQTFYSRLGDAFNSAAEQSPLFVSNGSDATLEREDGASWVAVPGVQMIEGIKAVELRPGKSYELIAQSSGAVPAGRYRIVVTYRGTASGDVTGRATSNVFDVK